MHEDAQTVFFAHSKSDCHARKPAIERAKRHLGRNRFLPAL